MKNTGILILSIVIGLALSLGTAAYAETLTIIAENGSVTSTPDLPSYDHNTQVTIEAVPDEGYHFSYWSGGLHYGSKNPLTITMNGDKIIRPIFLDVPLTSSDGNVRLTGAVATDVKTDSATIIWATDVPSTSTLEYGPDATYGTILEDPALCLNHNITIEGLTPDTTYYYRVTSKDSELNTAQVPIGTEDYIYYSLTTKKPVMGIHKTPQDIDSGGRPIVGISREGVLTIEEAIILQSDTYYLLQGDIHAEATAFWFGGNNITLDLNGYTIYYDELDIPEIPNGGFETADFTGWDMSGAAGWFRKKQLKAIDDYVLALPGVEGSVVLSPPFTIPKANYSFVATAYVNGLVEKYHRISLDFINANTGELIPPGIGYPEPMARINYANKDNDKELTGIANSIRLDEPTEVRLKITTTGPMLIDHVDFRGFLHPAVASSTTGGNLNPYHLYFAVKDLPAGVAYSETIHVINGAIIQGNARSGKAIVGLSKRFVLEDLNIIMQDTPNNRGIEQPGQDHPLTGAGNHIINNVLIEVPTVGVFHRDHVGGAIMLSGSAEITNSTIRTDTAGIEATHAGVGYLEAGPYSEGILIKNNTIEMGFSGHASMARNHFGINVRKFKKPMIYSNALIGQSHGAIKIDQTLEAEIFNNNITLWPRSGLRFRATSTARLVVKAIETYDPQDGDHNDLNSRWYSWHTRNKTYNNNVSVIIDPVLMEPESRVVAICYNIRNRYEFNQERAGDNSIYNNILTAINLQETLNSFGVHSDAIAVSFSGYSPEMKDKFFSNTIQSNDTLLSSRMELSLERGVDVYNNRMVRLDISPEHAYLFGRRNAFENMFLWDGGGLVIRDNIWENDASKYEFKRDDHPGAFRAENTITISVVDQNTAHLSNAHITITNSLGEVVLDGNADTEGKLTTILTDFTFNRGTDTEDNPHTIQATYGNFGVSSIVNVNEPKDIFLTINTTGAAPANQPPVVNAGEDWTLTSTQKLQSYSTYTYIYLRGSVEDDALPNPPGEITTTWSMVSDPDKLKLYPGEDAASLYTRVGLLNSATAHAFTLRLTADDGEYQTSDDITITLEPWDPNQKYTLTVSAIYPEYGYITKNPDKPEYEYGDTVELTAVPNNGYYFAGWFGWPYGADNPKTITITKDTQVNASFGIHMPITLRAVVYQGEGSVRINSNPPPSNNDPPVYGRFSEVTLEAIPAQGYVFERWSGNVPGSIVYDNPVTITLDNPAPYTVYAWFTAVLQEGDVNNDGKVDIADLIIVARAFGSTLTSPADIDGNGIVDIIDLITVARDFGKGI